MASRTRRNMPLRAAPNKPVKGAKRLRRKGHWPRCFGHRYCDGCTSSEQRSRLRRDTWRQVQEQAVIE